MNRLYNIKKKQQRFKPMKQVKRGRSQRKKYVSSPLVKPSAKKVTPTVKSRFTVTKPNTQRKVGSKPTNKKSLQRLKYLVKRYNTRKNNQEFFYNNSEMKSLKKVYNKKLNNKSLRKRLFTPSSELARAANHTRTQGMYSPVKFNLTKSKLKSKRLAKKKKSKPSRRSTYL